jgi:GYF domain 2
MNEREWHYVEDGQQCGPVSESRLVELLGDGTLGPATLVWTQGMKDWREASTVEGLVPGTPPPSQGAPPGPFRPERPASVTVFGILNIVFGSLGLLCMPLGLAMIFVSPHPIYTAAWAKVWMLFSAAVGFVCTILLIVVGIGLLYLKAWARMWAFGYGCFAIVWGIIGAGFNIWLMASRADGYSQQTVPSVIGGVCGGILTLVYPILLVIFMQRPNVKSACTR